MNRQDITFHNHEIRLVGSLYQPEGQPPYPTLVVLHAANGGTRTYPFYRHLIEYLPQQGMAVLLYDRRGSGASTGDFERAGFNDLAGDAFAAVDYLLSRDDVARGKIGLYGISQGGWIAPLVAAQRSELAFIIIVSGSGVSPARQMEYAMCRKLRKAGFSEQIVARAVAIRNRVNEYYRGKLPYDRVKLDLEQVQEEPWFGYTFLDNSDQLPGDITQDKWYYELDYDPLPVWERVTQPVLFLFADEDAWVPVAESMEIFHSVTRHLPDVSMLRIPKTDHLMADLTSNVKTEISTRYIDALKSWLLQRLTAFTS